MYRAKLKSSDSSECVAFQGVGLVLLRKSPRHVGPLALHRRRVDEHEEGYDQQEQRPMPGDREARRDQKASEIKGVPGVRVWSGRRESLVFRDVARGPGVNNDTDERDDPADRQRERRRARKNEIADAEYEAEWKSETLGKLGISQSASSLRR